MHKSQIMTTTNHPSPSDPQGRSWQPIATAPRDRTIHLARCTGSKPVWTFGKGRWLFKGYWGGDVWSWPHGVTLDSIANNVQPSHWDEAEGGYLKRKGYKWQWIREANPQD